MKKIKTFIKNLMISLIILNISTSIVFATETDAVTVENPFPEVTASSYMLLDQQTGNILAEYNMDEPVYPASTTKILAAIVVIENTDPEDIVTVTKEAFWNIEYGSSSAGIVEGEEMTVHDMLYCMMLASANEAANALAIHVGGTVEDFMGMMNLKAVQLGAYNSNFVNPNGLHDENHYTTARDMSIITKYALKNEFFALIAETAQKTIQATNKNPEKVVYTSNQLIFRVSDPRYYEYANGVKTGFTTPAGNCLVSQAEKNDVQLIGLLFNCAKNPSTGENNAAYKMVEMFEWGFSSYYNEVLIEQLQPMITVPVNFSSENDYVSLKTASDIEGLVPNNYDKTMLEIKYNIPESVDAPITVDQRIGTVQVSYDGVYYGEAELLAVNDVELSQVLYYVNVLEQFFISSTFRIILCSLVMLLILSVIGARIKQRRRRLRKKRRMQRQSQARTNRYR